MADEEVEEAPKKASKLPMIGAAVVALLIGVGGGFGAATFLGGGDAAADEGDGEEGGDGGDEAAEDGEAPAEGEEGEPPPPTRAVVSLGKFTVNLRGAGGGRMLRMQVDVEVMADDATVVEEKMALLRDGVLMLASDYTHDDLDGLDGKLRLRDELLGRLNTLAEEPLVKRVYFTEFVVQ
jgi:flagellar FliL protein